VLCCFFLGCGGWGGGGGGGGANAIIGILYALETPISLQVWAFGTFARKGKMEPVMQVLVKVVFRIFRDIEPVGEGMADVCTHTRASRRGVASLLFGALVDIGGKYRKN
jgi:hypothetical protein